MFKFVRYSMTILLATSISINTYANYLDKCIVEETINEDGYSVTSLENGRYYVSINGVKSKLESNLLKSSDILRLEFRPNNNSYINPSEIYGITEDIPYNYYSNLTASSEYVYSLLGNGYLINSYEAYSNTIYLELQNDKRFIRIIIYDDYLKVYDTEKQDDS